MKVGILSRHHLYHHGAMLQAYGLQKVLENLGCDVEIIDFREKSHERANWVIAYQPISLIKNVSLKNYIVRSTTLIGWSILNLSRRIRKKRIYEEFISQYMKYSAEIYLTDKELQDNLPIYDAYVVGSDQIWKIDNERGGLDHPFFLPFAPNDKVRITYAASLGKPRHDDKYIPELTTLLKNFDAISIREKSSIPFIQEMTDVDVVNVLDPALLIERKYWDEMCKVPDVPKRYIFVYSVTWNKNLSTFAKRVAKETGLKMVCVGPDYTKFGLFDSVCGPDTFIGYIKNAALVVTDSFHGTVFSIQYEKQFYSYPPKNEETRIADVLSILNLEDRMVSSPNDVISINSVIDYAKVNALLSKERAYSLDFLKESLTLNK